MKDCPEKPKTSENVSEKATLNMVGDTLATDFGDGSRSLEYSLESDNTKSRIFP